MVKNDIEYVLVLGTSEEDIHYDIKKRYRKKTQEGEIIGGGYVGGTDTELMLYGKSTDFGTVSKEDLELFREDLKKLFNVEKVIFEPDEESSGI